MTDYKYLDDAFKLGNKYIVRLGYRGFLSAVWMFWRMNRNARKTGVVMKFEFIVPMRWFR